MLKCLRAWLACFLCFLAGTICVGSSFESRVHNATAPLFVTYTTGAADRLALTLNLLTSLRLHSPRLAENSMVACFDDLACEWCTSLRSKQQLHPHASCYCIEDTVNATASDAYASAYWSEAVVRKVGVIRDFVHSKNIPYAVFADHDVVCKSFRYIFMENRQLRSISIHFRSFI